MMIAFISVMEVAFNQFDGSNFMVWECDGYSLKWKSDDEPLPGSSCDMI